MKNQIKYIAFLIALGLSLGFIVSAAPTITFQPDVFPISNNTYLLGSSTRQWLRITSQNASTTNFSVLSTGSFNLNATGTMQGYSICTAGNAACGAGGTGLSSLNGLTGATQTFATSTSGTNFNISSSGTVHTYNIPYAGSVNTGLLTFGDWTTFNNKVATTRAINTTAPIAGGGDLSADRTLTCNVASGSQAGCLASADWTTFNSKADYSFGANNFSGTGSFTGGNATTTGLTVSGGSKLGSLSALNISVSNATTTGLSVNGGTLLGSLVFGAGTSTSLSVTGGTSLNALSITSASQITNANLVNSTISGVALGGTLANLTATDGSLTFSGTYTGATARTIGLNLSQANSWTGAQTFVNATSSALSVTGGAQFASLTMSATSTMNGYSLCTSGNNACPGGGSGTVNTGALGQLPYYAAAGTVLTATSTINIDTSGVPTIGSGNEVMRITNGMVGIGTSSPNNLLTITGTTTPALGFTAYSLLNNGQSAWVLGIDTANENKFKIASSTALATNTRLTIDGAGKVGIGTTSPWRTLSVTGTVALSGLTVQSGAGNVLCVVGGQVVEDDSPLTACSGASSIKVKDDVVSLLSYKSLDDIMKMRPVSYRYKPEYKPTDQTIHYGFILEEIDKIDPLLVEYDKEGNPEGLKYGEFVIKAISAIQELKEKNDALEVRIKNLEMLLK